MEFKSLRNIESSFRQLRLFGMIFLAACTVVTVWSVWSSYSFAEKQREKIYVLDGGKSLMLALSQDSRRIVRQRRGNTCAAFTNCSSRWHLRRAPSRATCSVRW